jgi:hypothetical protein
MAGGNDAFKQAGRHYRRLQRGCVRLKFADYSAHKYERAMPFDYRAFGFRCGTA